MEVKIKKISPLKFNVSTGASTNFDSKKNFYAGEDSPLRIDNLKSEKISEKVNEAKEILEKAKRSLKNMHSKNEKFENSERNRIHLEGFNNQCSIELLACEMRMNVIEMQKQVKELANLTCELIEPRYYKLNKFPHPWRQYRNYLIKN